MRVLLIQPSEFPDVTTSRAYEKHGKFKILKAGPDIRRFIALPPLGLMYLAAPLLRAGHQVEILDAHTLQLNNAEIASEAVRANPDLIGITVFSAYLTVVHRLTRLLKDVVDAPILLGGPHVTAALEQSTHEFTSADYLLSGWAEMSILDMVLYLEGKKRSEDVPGLCFHRDGMIFRNQEPRLPDNADDITAPARAPLADMYESGLYFNLMSRRKRMDVLLTSRICPFSCKFCFSPGRAPLLAHSPERVFGEIKDLARDGVNAIEIMDDTFTVDAKRAESVADMVINSGMDIEFRIKSRVDQISPRLLAKFKRMGVRAVSYGMESGSQEVLDAMGKRTRVEQNETACRLTKQTGILCQTSWVLGYPGESRAQLEETFRFVERILPDVFVFYMLEPFPATAVYKEAKESGNLMGDWGVEREPPFVRTEEVRDKMEFESLVAGEQRRLLLKPRFVVSTVRYLVRRPNLRLLSYGIGVALRLVRRIEGSSLRKLASITRRPGG